MAAIELSLCDWRDVDARSDLDRFYLVRDHLPDARLVQYLEVMRGQGRDDYPVPAMWNALLAGVVFQHPSSEALLRELGRNPAVRQLEFLAFSRQRHRTGGDVGDGDGDDHDAA